MIIKPSDEYDLSCITFEDQSGNEGKIQDGTVVFGKEDSVSDQGSEAGEENDTSGGFMNTVLGLLGITAILAGISYICMKLWQRYKNA